MFNVVEKSKNPEIVVLTPLRTTDKIHKDLKKGLKRTNVNFDWVSYASEGNCPQNANLAFQHYNELVEKLPKYVIKLDNDIEPENHLLDFLYTALEKTDDSIGYSYCAFEMYGVRSIKFPLTEFSKSKLLKQNFISSNSLIKMSAFLSIDGFQCNKDYERLCDWVMWLRLLEKGYIGKPSKGYFKTELKENSISNRSVKDYYEKYNRIYREIVVSLKAKIGE